MSKGYPFLKTHNINYYDRILASYTDQQTQRTLFPLRVSTFPYLMKLNTNIFHNKSLDYNLKIYNETG